jgi:cell pole-organizing protein PopZ
MTQPAKAQEPSMEEILASIRRIIADDDPGKSQPAVAEAPPPPVPPPAPRVVAPPPRIEPPEPVVQEEEQIDTMLAQLQATSRAEPVDEPASDILELTEQMAAPAEPEPEFRTIDGDSDLMFEESAPEPAPPPREVPRRTEDRGLVSAVTSAAVDSAFNSLAQTVLVQNARSLEDLVREMLRPMLKTWLDDNLPGLVERLVRAEIERVSRGRG